MFVWTFFLCESERDANLKNHFSVVHLLMALNSGDEIFSMHQDNLICTTVHQPADPAGCISVKSGCLDTFPEFVL